ncbi:MAG: formyltransferase family protein [Bacteroidota bacterium]
MKIILLAGSNANHRALAGKVHELFGLDAVVVERRRRKPLSFQKKLRKLADRIRFYPIDRAWRKLMQYYQEHYPNWPDTELLEVENVNDSKVIEFVKAQNPELVMVSGTRILRSPILQALKPIARIINLHTGISPYVKGGPNCTNWCLANDTFHLIGNTVMWIDEGIDTGNLIATERTKFNGDESLSDIHLKVMEHGHDLYLRAVEKVLVEPTQCKNIHQNEIAEGDLFLTRMWNRRTRKALLQNIENQRFSKVVNSIHYQKRAEAIQLVEL